MFLSMHVFFLSFIIFPSVNRLIFKLFLKLKTFTPSLVDKDTLVHLLTAHEHNAMTEVCP